MKILTLGNKIKNRRKELGMTLKDLAGNRITPAQLSYVETDKCKPSLDLLEYISEKLGLEMNYLLESEKQQVSRFCQLNLSISRIDMANGDIEGAKKRLFEVLDTAQKYEMPDYSGQAHQIFGLICHYRGDYEDACEHFLNALYKFSAIDDKVKIGETYLYLGATEYERGHFKSSIGYLKQGEHFIDDAECMEIMLKFKMNHYLMASYSKIGDCKMAVEYGNKVTKNLKIIKDKKAYCQIITSIIKDMESKYNIDEAFKLAERANNLLEGADSLKFIGMALTHLGDVYSANSMLEESMGFLDKALEVKRITDDEAIPLTYISIAKNHSLKKDYERAFEILSEALNISLRTGNRKYEFKTYYALFEVFRDKGDFIKAEESIIRCGDILEAIGDKEELAECYINMAEFYKVINREKQALNCVLKAIDIYREAGKVPAGLDRYLVV